jgi:hypothetical protein
MILQRLWTGIGGTELWSYKVRDRQDLKQNMLGTHGVTVEGNTQTRAVCSLL